MMLCLNEKREVLIDKEQKVLVRAQWFVYRRDIIDNMRKCLLNSKVTI